MAFHTVDLKASWRTMLNMVDDCTLLGFPPPYRVSEVSITHSKYCQLSCDMSPELELSNPSRIMVQNSRDRTKGEGKPSKCTYNAISATSGAPSSLDIL